MCSLGISVGKLLLASVVLFFLIMVYGIYFATFGEQKYSILTSSFGDINNLGESKLREGKNNSSAAISDNLGESKLREGTENSSAAKSEQQTLTSSPTETSQSTDKPSVEHKIPVIKAEDILKGFLVVMKTLPYLFNLDDSVFTTKVNYTLKEKRMQELIDCVQYTLIHPLVKQVYVFYKDPQLVPYIQKQNMTHTHKLRLEPNYNDTMATMFRYANEHLRGSVVMLMNADVYPVEGFEQINVEQIKQNNLSYILSRYGKREKFCDLSKDAYANKCTPQGFTSSMDAYLFIPRRHFSDDNYGLLEHESNHGGIENVIAWVLQDERHKLLNPCLVLRIYHNHCGLQTKAGQPVNGNGKSVNVIPTSSLS